MLLLFLAAAENSKVHLILHRDCSEKEKIEYLWFVLIHLNL